MLGADISCPVDTRCALDLSRLSDAEPGSVALEGERWQLTYGELRRSVDDFRRRLDLPVKGLVAIAAPRSPRGVIAYLTTLAMGHTAVLVEHADGPVWRDVLASYEPNLLVLPDRVVRRRTRDHTPPIHPALALILLTSGSLGSPKTVRFSYDAVAANALAIAQALELDPADRSITSLPLDFSYGQSALTAPMAVGARTLISNRSPSSEAFWWLVGHHAVTTVASVSETCRVLRQRSWSAADYPSLRMVLHASAPLDLDTISYLSDQMASIGGEFVTMYGQTEANRMAIRPRGLPGHLGTVGAPIPGGRLWLRDEDGREAPPGQVGEIVYEGPNVMMGYAHTRADLARGDDVRGIVRTRDLGRFEAGLLHVVGRADRQIKWFGLKVNLGEMERRLSAGDASVVLDYSPENGLRAAVAGDVDAVNSRWRALAAVLNLPPAALRTVPLDGIPHTPRGKLDQSRLAELLDARTR